MSITTPKCAACNNPNPPPASDKYANAMAYCCDANNGNAHEPPGSTVGTSAGASVGNSLGLLVSCEYMVVKKGKIVKKSNLEEFIEILPD